MRNEVLRTPLRCIDIDQPWLQSYEFMAIVARANATMAKRLNSYFEQPTNDYVFIAEFPLVLPIRGAQA